MAHGHTRPQSSPSFWSGQIERIERRQQTLTGLLTRTQKLCAVSELPPGRTRKFVFTHEGIRREGFAANVRGHLVAYENACRHIPMPLDDDNDFFTTDGEFFICRTHGAIYEPLNGRCIHGPCGGLSLKALRVVEVDGELWVVLPEEPGAL